MLALLLAKPVFAHPAQSSTLSIDLLSDHAAFELHLPVDQLFIAAPEIFPKAHAAQNLDEALTIFSQFDSAAAADYLRQHIRLASVVGRDHASDELAWPMTVAGLQVAEHNGELQLVAQLNFENPAFANSSVGNLVLDYDVIAHRVINHITYASLRRDFALGVTPESTKLLPTLQHHNTHIEIDRTQASTLLGVYTVFVQGVHHILAGADHLLFLFCLLLTTPMVIKRGRWQSGPKRFTAIRQALLLVSAFTLGHTLTLIVAGLGWLTLPSAPVEVAIALTIALAAINLLKPVLKKYLYCCAGVFGLIHGLAFANSLSLLGLNLSTKLLTLMAFTAGIELVQAAIVMAVLPCLIVLGSRHFRCYRQFAAVTGGLALVAAVSWGLQRLQLPSFNSSGIIDAVAQQSPFLVVALWVLTLATVIGRRKVCASQ